MECDGRISNTLFFEDGSYATEIRLFDAMLSIEGLDFFSLVEKIDKNLHLEIVADKRANKPVIAKKSLETLYEIIPQDYKVNIDFVPHIHCQSHTRKYRFVQSLA